MKINLANIEEIIFRDDGVWSAIPRLLKYRNNWKLSQITPGLRDMAKRAFVDCINDMGDSEIATLTEHFGEQVFVEKISDKTTATLSGTHSELSERLCEMEGFSDYCVTSDGAAVSVTFWR